MALDSFQKSGIQLNKRSWRECNVFENKCLGTEWKPKEKVEKEERGRNITSQWSNSMIFIDVPNGWVLDCGNQIKWRRGWKSGYMVVSWVRASGFFIRVEPKKKNRRGKRGLEKSRSVDSIKNYLRGVKHVSFSSDFCCDIFTLFLTQLGKLGTK